MISLISSHRQAGRSWVLPLLAFAAFLAAGLLLQSWINRKPGQELVAKEVQNLRRLGESIWASSNGQGFGDLTTASAIQAQLVPASMLRASGAPVRSSWGGGVELLPHTVREQADGFLVRYLLLPPDACGQLATSMQSMVYDIRVNGESVSPGSGATSVDLKRACGMGQATVDFVYHPDLIPGTALPQSP